MRCNFRRKLWRKAHDIFFLLTIVFLSLQCDRIEKNKLFVSLNGDWHLVEGNLVKNKTPKDVIALHKTHSKKIFLPLGSSHRRKLVSPLLVWRAFFLENIPDQVLGIYLGHISSIDETYINASLIGKTGRLSPRVDEPIGHIRAYSIPSHFLKKGKNIIAIKIINPSYNISTGLYAKNIFITEYKIISAQLTKRYILTAILAFLALLTGVYFLIFARNVFDFEAIKYFGLGCIFLAIYIAFYGNFKYIFSDHFLALQKTEYSSLMVFPVLFLGYMFNLCEAPKSILFKIILGIASLFFIIFLTPAVKSTTMFTTLRFAQVYIIVVMLLGLFTYLKHYFVFTYKETIYISLGYASLLLTGLNDILVDIGLIDTPKAFNFGALGYLLFNSLFLNFKLNVLESSKKKQIFQFSELANHTLEDNNFEDFTKSCYHLIRNSLKYSFVAIEIISDNQEKNSEFSDEFLQDKINLIKNKKHGSQKIDVIRQGAHRKQLFFVPLYSLAKKKNDRGTLLISMKQDVIHEEHIQLLSTLQTTICAGIAHLDHKLQMRNLNKNLEKKVQQRTTEVNEQFRQLQEMQAKQTTFFASITHDIKTPLSLITMPIENLLKREEVFHERDQNALYKIKYNIYRMIGMINSVLDMAKFELKEVHIELTRGDISRFIQKLSNLYAEILQAHNLSLVTNIEPKKIFVLFDAEKIEKIMDNLINNAIKHSKSEGIINITLAQIDGTHSEIRVKNQGKGLSKKERTNLFKPFSQIYDAQGVHNLGSGLGLSISKQYIEKHEGTIDVESKKNEYTEFIFRLPLHRAETNENSNEFLNREFYLTLQNREMALAHKGMELKQDKRDINKIFCLLFDDKDYWATLINDLEEEFTLNFFSDEPTLIKNTDAQGISIMIITNELKQSYLKTIQTLKTSQVHRHLPILLLARSDPETIRSQCIVAGAEECLIEPIHSLEVNLKNQNFFAQHQLRREIFKKNFIENQVEEMNDFIIKEAKIDIWDQPRHNIDDRGTFFQSIMCIDLSKFYIMGESTDGELFSQFRKYCINMLMSFHVGKAGKEILPNAVLQQIQQIFPLAEKEKLLLCSGILSPDKKVFRYANASLPQTFFRDKENFKNIVSKSTGPPIQKNKRRKWKNHIFTFD